MNLPTVIIASVIGVLVIAIIARGIIKRKNGSGGCSCGCENCGMKNSCHGN